jgi:hypothetical protein
MRVVAADALDFERPVAPQQALDGLGALGPCHHHGVTLARRAPDPFADVVLRLELDAARREFPLGRCQVGLELVVGLIVPGPERVDYRDLVSTGAALGVKPVVLPPADLEKPHQDKKSDKQP